MLRGVAPHGDDVLLCLIAQPGRQAGQPNHRQRVRSPLTAPAVKESFWLRRQLRRTCRVNCGCIIVLKSTRPAWGEAGVTQGVRTAQPAVFEHIVFRERETRR